MDKLVINNIQRGILFVAALGMVLMIVHPPTYYWGLSVNGERVEIFSGYRFIGDTELIFPTQPKYGRSIVNFNSKTQASIYHIEHVRLIFQIIGMLLVTLFLFTTFQTSNDN